ncbi:hypothetical protein B9T07_08615 [Limnospira fusiformis CCALA 023]
MHDINPTVNFSAAGMAAEISSEDMRSLLYKIEAELHNSEVYQIAMQSLQKMLGEAATKAEIVIKAVGREAIQLSVKQLIRQQRMMLVSADQTVIIPPPQPSVHSPTPQPTSETSSSPSKVEVSAKKPKPPTDNSPVSSPEDHDKSHSQLKTRQKDPTPKPKTTTAKKKKPKKLTPAQQAEKSQKRREVCLCQIGKKLQKTRAEHGITLQQVHHYTLIPVKVIQAIEKGQIDRLPEDIYLRGFICRLGNALGLNGSALAGFLPTPSPDPTLVRSWSKIELDSRFYLNSVHLYLGYTAILAASLGGIAWIADQPLPETELPPDLPEIKPDSKSESEAKSAVPGLKNHQQGIVLGADIAPPERISPELIPQELISMELSNFIHNP